MTPQQYEKLYKLMDRMDDRLWYMTVMTFFIMVGVCSQ
jgi:hypothetical protein